MHSTIAGELFNTILVFKHSYNLTSIPLQKSTHITTNMLLYVLCGNNIFTLVQVRYVNISNHTIQMKYIENHLVIFLNIKSQSSLQAGLKYFRGLMLHKNWVHDIGAVWLNLKEVTYYLK